MYGLVGYGFMVKTDNTAYQALVLVWLGCGKTIKDCKKDSNSRVPDEDIFYSDIEDEGNKR